MCGTVDVATAPRVNTSSDSTSIEGELGSSTEYAVTLQICQRLWHDTVIEH